MLGSGRLGASVWGGTTSERIALNEDTVRILTRFVPQVLTAMALHP
jgi:hypothetical protein